MRMFYRRLRPLSVWSLPHTCLEWINASHPLGANVAFFPRSIRLANDFFHGVLWQGGLLLFFAGFAYFGFLPPTERVSENPYLVIFLYSFMCLMLGGFVWIVLRFLETWSAWRQQRRGMLRLGVFVGEHFLLVRLRRHRCYLIARSEYIKSWAWQDGESGSLPYHEEAVVEYFIIESQRGEITVYSSQLEVTADDLHQHVLRMWPEKWHVEGQPLTEPHTHCAYLEGDKCDYDLAFPLLYDFAVMRDGVLVDRNGGGEVISNVDQMVKEFGEGNRIWVLLNREKFRTRGKNMRWEYPGARFEAFIRKNCELKHRTYLWSVYLWDPAAGHYQNLQLQE